MAHIAIDARIINSSTGTYVERLLHYLEKIDTVNTYSVLVPPKDKHYWKPTSPNFNIKTIDIPNYSFKEQLAFLSYLEKLSPDLVHFCMPQQPILYRGLSVTTVHDLTLLHVYNSDKNWLIYHVKQLIGRFVFKRIASTNQHIMTPSQYTKEAYCSFSGISPDQVTVTYEAADISIGKTTTYDHPFSSYILYVGQQSDYKNIVRLAAAHQKLLAHRPDLGLILVGKLNKSARANKALFESNGYTNILFTDFIPNTQRDWLYQHAEAYIFPSLMEGFGLPGLEAMGYGTPVVSSNATCLPEIYGDAALYFDPENVNDMAAAIERVLSDTSLQKSLVKKGYARLKNYSWEKMAKETLKVYTDVLGSEQVLTSSSVQS